MAFAHEDGDPTQRHSHVNGEDAVPGAHGSRFRGHGDSNVDGYTFANTCARHAIASTARADTGPHRHSAHGRSGLRHGTGDGRGGCWRAR
jgi:hypothetical protein